MATIDIVAQIEKAKKSDKTVAIALLKAAGLTAK